MYLERLLAILETVAQPTASKTVSVSEIVAATGLPKPSVYRQVGDLVDAGLLEQRENGKLTIGVRLKRLSGHYITDSQVRELAGVLLKRAARTHQATFFLSELSGDAVEIVQAEVPNTGVSYLHPGIGPRPLHACSCAKAIAAFSPDPAIHKAMIGRLKSFTANTKTSVEDLDLEFQSIRQNGFAECVEEVESGVCSVAAPVVMADGRAVYSLGATGTKRVFSPDRRKRFGRIVMDLCAEMAVLLDDTQVQAVRMSS